MNKINLLPDNHIIKLRELTKALEFAGIVHEITDQQIIELEVDAGTSYMVGLYKTPIIAVARNYASAGCKFPLHQHDEWELLLVYQGELHLYAEGRQEKKVLKEQGFYYLMPRQGHRAYFPVETWFLAITMPASESWPDGG